MWTLLLRGLRRLVRRALVALVVGGTLMLGYSVGLVWVETGSAPTTLIWLLIGPMAAVVALLSATIVVLRGLAPLLAMPRLVRFLTQMPAILAGNPAISNRELARQLDCSEAEAATLRDLLERPQQHVPRAVRAA